MWGNCRKAEHLSYRGKASSAWLECNTHLELFSVDMMKVCLMGAV